MHNKKTSHSSLALNKGTIKVQRRRQEKKYARKLTKQNKFSLIKKLIRKSEEKTNSREHTVHFSMKIGIKWMHCVYVSSYN